MPQELLEKLKSAHEKRKKRESELSERIGKNKFFIEKESIEEQKKIVADDLKEMKESRKCLSELVKNAGSDPNEDTTLHQEII